MKRARPSTGLMKVIEASTATAPTGSDEDERLRARADREPAMGHQRRARDVMELIDAVGPYAQRVLMGGTLGDDMTVARAIDFAVDRYDVPPLLAALALRVALGSRIQLARSDLQSVRQVLGLEAGDMLRAGAAQARAVRRRGWKQTGQLDYPRDVEGVGAHVARRARGGAR
jgi:hypothetical protein